MEERNMAKKWAKNDYTRITRSVLIITGLFPRYPLLHYRTCQNRNFLKIPPLYEWMDGWRDGEIRMNIKYPDVVYQSFAKSSTDPFITEFSDDSMNPKPNDLFLIGKSEFQMISVSPSVYRDAKVLYCFWWTLYIIRICRSLSYIWERCTIQMMPSGIEQLRSRIQQPFAVEGTLCRSKWTICIKQWCHTCQM